MKLTVPCCRRLCPEMKVLEHWVMKQSDRWNGGSFWFGQRLFSENWQLWVFSNYYFNLHKTELLLKIVKQTVNF